MLQPGDSGSWVVNSRGEIFGHVIAQAGDCAYIMPLRDVLNGVRKYHSAWLPSPFEVLVDIAEAEPDWESNGLYTSHSWTFDAVRFLLREPYDVRNGIIRILTDVLTKSDWNITSGLTSMWQRENIGSLQDISRITRLHIAREVINEVAKLSQVCGVEPPDSFLVDLETFMENSFLNLTEGVHTPQSLVGDDDRDKIQYSQNTTK